MRFRVNIRLLALYAFSLVIMYLAGVYFGTFLFSLFIMFLVLPPLTFAAFLTWIANVSCSQVIDRITPVKGDLVQLTFRIDNHSILPVPRIGVVFARVSETLQADLADFDMYLSPKGRNETTYQIMCPYRGTYEVGVASIEVSDPFGFFAYRKRLEPVRITVYPRILEISRFAPIANDVEGSGRYSSAGLLPDTTLFYQLKEYREGDGVRHIYWKKYAATGVPYLKEYDLTKRAGVRIYFDCRPTSRWDINRLEQEDVSVEALVALVRYLLHHRVHTTVLAGTDPRYRFSGDSFDSFGRFYQSTTRLTFRRGVSPLPMFRHDHAAGNLESQTCIFITHVGDPGLFGSTVGSGAYDTIFLMNAAGLSTQRAEKHAIVVADARRRGKQVVVIRSGETIIEDLAGRTRVHDDSEDSGPTVKAVFT